MAMEITDNYNGCTAQCLADSRAKKKEAAKTERTENSETSKSIADYKRELAKLAPSVDFRVGNSYSSAQHGKTLTISPKLLEKMQNDPEKEKEMKELIKGVETATKLVDSIHKASGWSVVYRHGYIDENGKYCAIAYVRNEFGYKMSDKLREERQENSEKLLEKQKEKSEKKKETLEQLLDEKITASKDGVIYLYDTDMKTIMEAAKEDNEDKANPKEPVQAGANLDLQV